MASRKRAKAPMSLTNTHYFTSTLALSLKVLYCHLPADIFVETGSYKGDAIRLALSLGFKEVHSIELDAKRSAKLDAEFADMPDALRHKVTCENAGKFYGFM